MYTLERQLFRVSIRWTFEGIQHDHDAYVAIRQDYPLQMMRDACLAALSRVIGPQDYQYKRHAEVTRIELIDSVFVEPETKDDRRRESDRIDAALTAEGA